MAKKNLNDRCPLQAECERKCTYSGRELDCDYYANNGVGEDRTIPDQEDRRREAERQDYEKQYEADLADTVVGECSMLTITVEVNAQEETAQGMKERIAMDLERYGDVRAVSVEVVQSPQPVFRQMQIGGMDDRSTRKKQ